MQLLLSQQYFFKPMTNERTIDRIVNNMFEEMDAFSKLKIIFESKSKIEPAMQNMIFGDNFQSALICPILTHFDKKYFLEVC